MTSTPASAHPLDRLVTELKTDPPFDDDGVTVVPICDEGTVERILALLPGEWSMVAVSETEDVTSAVYTCARHFGVFAYGERCQAGLFGTVALCPDEAAFARRATRIVERYPRE